MSRVHLSTVRWGREALAEHVAAALPYSRKCGIQSSPQHHCPTYFVNYGTDPICSFIFTFRGELWPESPSTCSDLLCTPLFRTGILLPLQEDVAGSVVVNGHQLGPGAPFKVRDFVFTWPALLKQPAA